jgi:hypothetical protein
LFRDLVDVPSPPLADWFARAAAAVGIRRAGCTISFASNELPKWSGCVRPTVFCQEGDHHGMQGSGCSSSHAAAGIAMPIKIAKNVARNAHIRMIISPLGLSIECYRRPATTRPSLIWVKSYGSASGLPGFSRDETRMPAKIATLLGLAAVRGLAGREDNMQRYETLVELARLCAQQSRASNVKEAATELWLMAKEYQEEAAQFNGGKLPEIGKPPPWVRDVKKSSTLPQS